MAVKSWGFLLCCGFEQCCISHILLNNVYNCIAFSFLKEISNFNKWQIEELSAENHFEFPLYIALCCTNVLNVLVLEAFLSSIYVFTALFLIQTHPLKELLINFNLFTLIENILWMIPNGKVIMNVRSFLFLNFNLKFHHTLVQTMHGK